MKGDERQRALDKAVRALARRDHSAGALRARLDRAGIAAEVGEGTVADLVRAGYVDDQRFASARAEQLADRGYGDEWIRGDLASQEVPAAAVEEAIAELAPERERAIAQAARLGDPPRAARTLARKGFSEDSLEAVLGRGIAETP